MNERMSSFPDRLEWLGSLWRVPVALSDLRLFPLFLEPVNDGFYHFVLARVELMIGFWD